MTVAGGDRTSWKAMKKDSKLVRCADGNLFVNIQTQIKFDKKRMVFYVSAVNHSHHITEAATALVKFHIQLDHLR